MKEHSVRFLEEDAVIPSSPFKHYPDIAALIDILSRQEKHHVLLIGPSSKKIQHAIIHGVAQQLKSLPVPTALQDVEVIYVDAIVFQQEEQINYRKDNQRIIAFTTLSHYPTLKWDFANDFTCFHWKERNEEELALTLKSFGTELENFHHVSMTKEIFSSAISMASHYLPGTSYLEKALELLDSASARASAVLRHDGEQNPLVTSAHLAQIVANLTQIPLLYLQENHFQTTKFIEAMQRNIFGQEQAIQRVSMLLQSACIKLQKKSGPLCSLLLAGQEGVGKAKLAYAMAEHLFGDKEKLLLVNPQQLSLLFSGIQQAPYSIVLLKNIEQVSAKVRYLFQDILLQGYAIDDQGIKYDFRHAIIILTTKLGADRIAAHCAKTQAADTGNSDDLMELVLNTHLSKATLSSETVSPQDICEEVLSVVAEHFSDEFLHGLNMVPFIPLDYHALEKIMHVKLKSLAKQLERRFQLELHYAPEVVKFLAHEVERDVKSLDKLLDRHLYGCVTRAMLTYAEDKNKSQQLLLQLNDNGHVLRCEFVTSNEIPLYR